MPPKIKKIVDFSLVINSKKKCMKILRKMKKPIFHNLNAGKKASKTGILADPRGKLGPNEEK